MKLKEPVSLLVILALYVAILPPGMDAQAQTPVAGIRLAATRGRVELLAASGRWEQVKGPINAAVGVAIRTSAGAELTATFNDGSTMTLGETSALKFTELTASSSGYRVGAKVMGQLTASLSPQRVASDNIALDFPVGRATINRQFAIGHAVRDVAASSRANIKAQTPTGRAVRVAVVEGASTLQALRNITGSVVATDPDSGSFTLKDERTGRARRVVVGNSTLLAASDVPSSRISRTPRQIVSLLALNSSLVVYGESPVPEGPGGELAQGITEGPVFNASIVFPPGGDYLDAETYLNTPVESAMGNGMAAETGNTLTLTAGQLLPIIVSGIALSSSITSQVGAYGGAAAGIGTVAAVMGGVGVVTAAAIVSQQSNLNKGPTNTQSSNSSNTGTLTVTVTRPRGKGRVLANGTLGGAPILAAPSFGNYVLGSGFRGSTTSALMQDAGPSTIVGRWKLGRNLKMHLGLEWDGYDPLNPMGLQYGTSEVDFGFDYMLDADHAFGAGLRSQTVNVMDPTGNVTQVNTGGPELRFLIRY